MICGAKMLDSTDEWPRDIVCGRQMSAYVSCSPSRQRCLTGAGISNTTAIWRIFLYANSATVPVFPASSDAHVIVKNPGDSFG